MKVCYNKEEENAKKIGAKKANSFRIDDSWYNDDGSIYDANKDPIEESDPDNFYMDKIKKLEEQLKETKKNKVLEWIEDHESHGHNE